MKARFFTTAALLSLAGAAFLFIILQAEFLLFGLNLEELSRALYRPAFIVLAPFRGFAMIFAGPFKGHFPLGQTVLLSLIVPAMLYGALWVLWRLWPGHRARRLKAAPGTPSISRRGFLAACGAAPMGGAGFYGVYVEPERLRIVEYTVPVRGLPAKLDGLRIAHVSDTHYGPFVTARYLEGVVAHMNALEPDMVLLTGDYVHKTPRSIHVGIGLLGGFRSRFGTLAVLGNHEHWEGAEACRKRFHELGIQVLDNRHCFLGASGLRGAGVPGESLCLAGVEDLWDGQPSLEAALAGVDPAIPRLVLSHNPDFAESVNPGYRVDLMLAGHTHGGQVRLPVIGAPGIPSRYGEKYAGGLCQGPWCPVIVSRGVGLAGLPIRLGVPPEAGLITLKAADPRAEAQGSAG